MRHLRRGDIARAVGVGGCPDVVDERFDASRRQPDVDEARAGHFGRGDAIGVESTERHHVEALWRLMRETASAAAAA